MGLLLVTFLYPKTVPKESILNLSDISQSAMIFATWLINTFIFATCEKLIKEYWVIRDTYEKSFKTFMTIVDDSASPIFILNDSWELMYANKSFGDSMLDLIKQRYPDQLSDFVHTDNFEAFKTKIQTVISDQTVLNETVNLRKIKIYDKDSPNNTGYSSLASGNFGLNFFILLLIFNSFYFALESVDIYEWTITPTNWKHLKVAMITLRNIMDIKVKQKLLFDQANEISTQFHDIVNILEQELADDGCMSHSSSHETSQEVIKNLHLSSNKVFNDFLFIKNIFELDCDDFRFEKESFQIKDFFFYWIDQLLSRTQNKSIKVWIDPCMPEEVEGDLLKFKQIVTSILDFTLKSTSEIEINLHANFQIATGGYMIDFWISFTPNFEIKETELKLLFGQKGIYITKSF